MIIVEYSTDDYGKVMKHLACIKEKAEELECMLLECTFDLRKPKRWEEDDEEKYIPKRYTRYGSSRYVR